MPDSSFCRSASTPSSAGWSARSERSFRSLASHVFGLSGISAALTYLLASGWLVGLPVPLLLTFAPSWSWIVVVNLLLGVNQGLAWSMTVIMKIDLVGSARLGLAMGLNEAVGFGSIALTALLTGLLRPRRACAPRRSFGGRPCAIETCRPPRRRAS